MLDLVAGNVSFNCLPCPQSHLFSLGMTLLFATEYNTGSDDPRAEISDTFTDLLTSLTQDDSQLRPDLDTVIEASEKRLGEESSQDICLRIVGLQPQHGKAEPQGIHQDNIQLNLFTKCLFLKQSIL